MRRAAVVRTAVVTGGSSGIGRATCERLRDQGYRVYELSRREVPIEGVTHLSCDITVRDEVAAAVAIIRAETDKVHLLVNNAGFGISGAAEYTDPAQAKALFELNFFGTLDVTQEAMPLLKAAKGRIINLSSVAAILPIPFQSFYSASKAAINALTMCLANELRPFGVSATALMPGDVATGFTQARQKSVDGDETYGGHINKAVSAMEKDERNGMPPERIAKRICRIASKRSVKPLYTVGAQYKLFAFLQKALPARFTNFVVGKLY